MMKKTVVVLLIILIVGMLAATFGVAEDIIRTVNIGKDPEVTTTVPAEPEPPPAFEDEIWTGMY